MNLGDVQIRVQKTFGDEAESQISLADIARWATDAQVDIVRRAKCNEVEAAPILTVGGQAKYLISDILDFIRVTLDGTQLQMLTRQTLDQTFPTRGITGYGTDTPAAFIPRVGGLELYPVPTLNNSVLLVTYNKRPPPVVIPTDLFEIPEQYHETIVRRVLQRAYELDGQWQAADRMGSDVKERIANDHADQKDKNEESYPAVRLLPGDY